MRIESTRFGSLEIPEQLLIRFRRGIIGLENTSTFVIVDHAEGSALRWMQSVERPEVAFPVLEATRVDSSYRPELPEEDLRAEGIRAEELTAVAAVLNVQPGDDDDNPQLHANLLAPLVLGVESRRGVQVVLHDGGHPLRTPVSPLALHLGPEARSETGSPLALLSRRFAA